MIVNTNDILSVNYNTNKVSKLLYKGNEVWSNSLLPKEYIQLEYIESTGTLYIDTNIVPDYSTTGLFCEFMNLSTTDTILMGTCGNIIDARMVLNLENDFIYESWITTSPKYLCNKTTKHVGALNYLNTKEVLLDNSLLYNITSNLPNCIYYSICLFAAKWRSDSVTLHTKARIYAAKISKGNQIMCDLIPALRKSNNTIGMYDLVSNQFFTNQGTGEFIGGYNLIQLLYLQGFWNINLIQSESLSSKYITFIEPLSLLEFPIKTLQVSSEYNLRLIIFNEDKIYINKGNNVSNKVNLSDVSNYNNAKYFSINLSKVSGDIITPEEAENIQILVIV